MLNSLYFHTEPRKETNMQLKEITVITKSNLNQSPEVNDGHLKSSLFHKQTLCSYGVLVI